MESLTVGKTKKDTHPLNSTWVIWYHNPSDNNWETKSYIKLYEISTLEDFFRFQNTWKNNLPRLNLSMMFMMKKLDNYEYIYPMWEDTNNKPGGCWSFKVSSTNIDHVWTQLCFYIMTANTSSSEEVTNSVNGISFSPKKGFCIVKIWNATTENQDINLLNPGIETFLDFSTCIYKSHVESIDKDNKKKKKIEDFRNNVDRQERSRLDRRNNRKNKNNRNNRNNGGGRNKRTTDADGFTTVRSGKGFMPRNRNQTSTPEKNYVDYKNRFNTDSKFVWGKRV
jgi:hypothetical protein